MSWASTKEGLEIYYEAIGTGAPIVFQSGYMGIHDIWKYQVAALKDRFFCITHDNRGYGMSAAPEEYAFYTMERIVEDTKAVIDAAGVIEPALFVTHSMGGNFAIAFAERYPELVKGIMMMGGPGISGKTIREHGGHDEMFSGAQLTPSMRRDFYYNIGLSDELAKEASKWNFKAFTKQTRAVLQYEPGESIREVLTQPVEVICSKEDLITDPAFPQEIVDRLPNAEMIMIDGCRHFPQVDRPELITKMILDFYEAI